MLPAGRVIKRNRRWFRAMLAAGLAAEWRGRYEEAARWAAAAASWATHDQTGLYRSLALDNLVARLGRRLSAPGEELRRPDGIVHLITYAPPVGGHLRWLSGWIRLDTAHTHHVVITREEHPPDFLRAVVAASGGTITGLSPQTRAGPLLEQASSIRASIGLPKAVISWHHMDDVLAVLALARTRRPPVAAVNQSDHLFSVCLPDAEILVEQRRAGLELSQHSRGARPQRQRLVPLPLPPVQRRDRALARRSLGIGDDEVVLFVMGNPYRFAGASPTLADLLSPLLACRPRTRLFAVGPADQPDWQRLASGKPHVSLLPRTPDVSVYEEAADIYLDSYPIGGLTSCLQSAALGTACISLQTLVPILSTNAPGLSHVVVCRTPSQFSKELIALIDDPGRRRAVGHQLRHDVQTEHGDAVVSAAIEDVYTALRARTPALGPVLRTTACEATPLVLHVLGAAGIGQYPPELIRRCFDGQPSLSVRLGLRLVQESSRLGRRR